MDRAVTKAIFGLLSIGIIISCEEDNINNNPTDFAFVKYGTTFGECIGYCIKSIKISDSKIEFKKNGWDLDSNLPQIIFSETINEDYWIKLVEKIDFDNFWQLDSIIGCPDCADSGAEWIEIKKKDINCKVVFEYRNEPDIVKGYIGYLRTYINSFEIDSVGKVNFNNRTLINQHGTIKNSVCTRGCYQYLIELIDNNDMVYYYDKHLDPKYQKDNLLIRFNGVLQYDSTMIYKPAPNDIPLADFKVRNIKLCDIEIISN